MLVILQLAQVLFESEFESELMQFLCENWGECDTRNTKPVLYARKLIDRLNPIFGNDIAQEMYKQFWFRTPQVLQGGGKCKKN